VWWWSQSSFTVSRGRRRPFFLSSPAVVLLVQMESLTAIHSSAVGTNHVYQTVAGSCHLLSFPIQRERVRMVNRPQGAIFIENHNFNCVKDKNAGRVIAIHDEIEDVVHFVVATQVTEQASVSMFYQRWTGGTDRFGLPLFCLSSKDDTWENFYQKHFESECLQLSFDRKNSFKSVQFCNQIFRRRAGNVPLAADITNLKDGGIQCSSHGPDAMLPLIRHWPRPRG
jgi:hypothetical protein